MKTGKIRIIPYNNVYVSFKTGSDRKGVGTVIKPYRTIAKALKSIKKNKQIVVTNGEYKEGEKNA